MINQNIDKEALPVNNEDKRHTIIRVVHNRENPFVQLNKEALWDSDLSLKAVGLWSRCMSRPNDWVFSIKEITAKCKEGRKVIDSAMDELIQFSYACRMEYTPKDSHGKFIKKVTEYVFFEFPATEEEKSAQMEIFKKSFRNSQNRNFRFAHFRKNHLLIQNSTDIQALDKKDISPPIPPHQNADAANAAEEILESSSKGKKIKPIGEFSPQVKELAEKMVKALHEANPHWLMPKTLYPMMTLIDEMISKQNREPKVILDVFIWAVNDHFWMDKLCKANPAKYLKDNFGQLAGKMNAKPMQKPRKFAPSSDDNKAYEILKSMSEGAL